MSSLTISAPTKLHLANRMSRLGTETAFEVLVRARALERQGKNIVHLEIGEPDFDTPGNIVEAAVGALQMGYTHYGPSAGLLDLREAIAEDVTKSRGVKFTSDEVVVVPGGKPIIFFTLLALVEEGDEVIYPNPGFPIYESMINFLGAKAVPIPLREERDFRIDVNELKSLINDRTKLIILNSPQNPTGGVLTKGDIYDIADAIGDRDIMVLSDEIYGRLLFEGEQFSISGIEAIRGDQSETEHMRLEFQKRRNVFVNGINQIKGFSCLSPKGAFYTFPNIKQTGWASKKLADALLDDAGVAALSGTAFGAFGEGYLRFSVANSVENIQTALDRIDQWTKKNL